jgi:uncharacterized protein
MRPVAFTTSLLQVGALAAGLSLLGAGQSRSESAHWWQVGRGGTPARYVDFADVNSIQVVGDSRRMWTLAVYRKSPPPLDHIYTMKGYATYDCMNKQIGTLEAITYGIDGNVLNNATTPYPSMSFVVPDSVGQAEWEFACADRDTKPASALDLMGMDPEAFALATMGGQTSPVTNQSQPFQSSHKNVPRLYHPK